MTTLLFYNEPVALNRDAHKNLRYQASSDFSVTESVNSLPLAGVEFFEASRNIPAGELRMGDMPNNLRSANRSPTDRHTRNNQLGFRVVIHR